MQVRTDKVPEQKNYRTTCRLTDAVLPLVLQESASFAQRVGSSPACPSLPEACSHSQCHRCLVGSTGNAIMGKRASTRIHVPISLSSVSIRWRDWETWLKEMKRQ